MKDNLVYRSIEDLPVWNFHQVNKTGDLGFLYREYQKATDRKLLEYWQIIFDEYIQDMGISQVFKDYLRLKIRALEFYKQAYVDGEKYKRVLAQIKEQEAEALLEKEKEQSIYDVASYLTKMGFGNLNLKEISVKQFNAHLKLAQKNNG